MNLNSFSLGAFRENIAANQITSTGGCWGFNGNGDWEFVEESSSLNDDDEIASLLDPLMGLDEGFNGGMMEI